MVSNSFHENMKFNIVLYSFDFEFIGKFSSVYYELTAYNYKRKYIEINIVENLSSKCQNMYSLQKKIIEPFT